MKKSTIYQNRLACKKAVELYLNGQIADAKQAAKRVSWSFLFCFLYESEDTTWNPTSSALDCYDLTNAIKGFIEV